MILQFLNAMPSSSELTVLRIIAFLFSIIGQTVFAQVSLTKNEGADFYTLSINGKITQEFANDFQKVIDDVQSSKKKLHLNLVHLNSHGGSDRVAVELGRKIRKYGLNTFVAPDALCNSACVYIFIGGIERYSFGKFGVHRTTYESGTEPSRRFTPGIVDQNIQKVHEYIREQRISSHFANAILDTPSWTMRYLTMKEMYDWGINGTDRAEADVQLLEIAKERGLDSEMISRIVSLNLKDCHQRTVHLKETMWTCLRNRHLSESIWSRLKRWFADGS